MSNPADITARIIALRSQMTGVTTASDKYPEGTFTAAQLPYLVVLGGGATYSSPNSDTLVVVREWTLELWVKAFDQGSLTSEKAAYDACLPFLSSIPKFFWQRRRLQSAGNQGLAFVQNAEITRDFYAQALTHNQGYFYGVPFRLNVTYTEDLTQV